MNNEKHTWFSDSTNQDYICLFTVHIHKRILKIICFLILLIPVGLFGYEIYETYRLTKLNEREKITYRFDDIRLMDVNGYIILLNEKDQIVYEGEFSEGKCNGMGKVYQDEVLHYEGNLLDNVYEDEKGKLYDAHGYLRYEGGFVKGKFEGEGFLYYPNGDYQAQGTYKNGEMNGEGIRYHEDGSIQDEGEYLYGNLNGQGISYYKGSNIRFYKGNFMGNVPLGEGILYSTSGRAYYQGLVYNGEPDFEAYIGATYEEIRTHFLDPISIYTTQEDSAIVIAKRKVMFLSKKPYFAVGESKDAAYTKDAIVNGVDESKYFIDAIAMPSSPLKAEDKLLYEDFYQDASLTYKHRTTTYDRMDLYMMMFYQLTQGVSPLDAFLHIQKQEGEVTTFEMSVPSIKIDRYEILRADMCQATMMINDGQRWSYEILQEVVKEE